MSDTDKQTFVDLYVKNLRSSANLLDVRIKSILAFKICKLISLEYFELPNRNILVIIVASA